MAAVRIVSGPRPYDRASEVPQSQWRNLVDVRQYFCKERLPADCRQLLFFVQDAEENDWLGYGSREQYLVDGLTLDPEIVDWAIAGLRRIDPNKPVPIADAVHLGKHGHAADEPRDQAGRYLPREPVSLADSISIGKVGGTSYAYTLARLDRDRPDLAAQVRAGERSANAAAIEAGFRKLPTPLQQLQRAWTRANTEERAAFLDWVQS